MCKDTGIDKVGPKVRNTGPYDEDRVDPDELYECEGCGRRHYMEALMDISSYGLWCHKCLVERLMVE